LALVCVILCLIDGGEQDVASDVQRRRTRGREMLPVMHQTADP
jgi:hypothetical protein